MVALTFAAARSWARFDHYVVHDGYVCPDSGAKVEIYELCDRNPVGQIQARKTEPTYCSLLNLAQKIELKPRPGPGPLLTFSENCENRVMEWCSQFGLLGVLPHAVHMVTLAPRYGPLPDVEGRWVPWQRQYLRVNQEWVRRDLWDVQVGATKEGDVDQWMDKLVPPEEIPKGWPKSEVALQDLTSGKLKKEPLAKTWGKFFPTVPQTERDTYAYPVPNSAEFWNLYAEPIPQFVEAATLFLSAAQGIGRLAEHDLTHDARGQVERAVFTLNSLLSPTGSAAVLSNKDRIEQHWMGPSLLGAFAMMALRDFSEQRLVRTCANAKCRRIFVTKAYQGRYCSDKCRYATQKRRYRDRHKRRMASQ